MMFSKHNVVYGYVHVLPVIFVLLNVHLIVIGECSFKDYQKPQSNKVTSLESCKVLAIL